MRKRWYGFAHNHVSPLYRRACYLLIGFVLLMICTITGIVKYFKSEKYIKLEFGVPEFLVNSDQCKIPNVLPWNSEFKEFYEAKYPYKCSKEELLTGIAYKGNQAYLYINKSVEKSYSKGDIDCCYQTLRRGTKDTADIEIKYSDCYWFGSQKGIVINSTEVIVKCSTKNTDKIIYNNAHSVIFKSPIIKNKIAALQHKEKPPSVLLIGIDSVSRLNFHRMLPMIHQYLDMSGWVEYKGFNKVGENTFPNLMALLTGRNASRSFDICNPYNIGVLDHCNFIWKNYSKSKYVTAYIEDAINISTFTYLKKGFLHPPTDLYYKPYMTSAEDIGTTTVDGMKFCSGPVSSGERILQVVKEFVEQIGDHPKFGLFWSNSFSHDDVNAPARMDKILADFFQDLQKYLNNTIVFFFSDHGMRFGDIRRTKTGWYEERLPYAYFWFPHNFREKFPVEYKNAVANSEKLTTPYDVYMTLQHILELYDKSKVRISCDATKKCKSVFEDVGDRSCEQAGIPTHYCACFGYKPFHTRSPVTKLAGEFAVNELNTILKQNASTSLKCAQYQLDKITLAQIAFYKNTSYLLFQLETIPKAVFEFTVTYKLQNEGVSFKRQDWISRLDKYEETSKCVTENKLYCYCQSNLQMNLFGFWFEVW